MIATGFIIFVKSFVTMSIFHFIIFIMFIMFIPCNFFLHQNLSIAWVYNDFIFFHVFIYCSYLVY